MRRDVNNRQSGMVSIMTVLFFMIFISVIVVGFVRIVSYEQRQSTDNDLSSSALAAAQSGIEDGKRILAFCRKGNFGDAAQDSPGCASMLNSGTDCSVLTGPGNMNSVRNQLNIQVTPSKEIPVGDPAGGYKQYYSCLTMSSLLDTYSTTIKEESKSQIIPLTLDNPNVGSLTLNWGRTKGSYDVDALTALTKESSWTTFAGTRKPPILRVQVIPYKTGGAFSTSYAEQNSRTIFLRPTNSVIPAVVGPQDINTVDARAAAGQLRGGSVPIMAANCAITPGAGYSCSKKITGLTGAVNSYYLRVSILYDTETDLVVQAADAGGTPIRFSGAQTAIDATGRTNDVYRRVRAVYSFGKPDYTIPEFAVETGSDICKNMQVTGSDTTSLDYCSPIPPPPPPAVGCTISGGNFVRNSGFTTLAGNGPFIDPAAEFTSELPNRGTGVYPDDAGNNGIPGAGQGWTGGLSIQTGPVTYNYLGTPFASAVPFPGDPTSGIPGSPNYLYTNPNQAITDPKGYDAIADPFTGVLWGQQVTGLTAGKTYVFAAYFNNMLIPGTVDESDPGYKNPFIRLRVNGVSTPWSYEVRVTPDDWMPVSVLFTAPVGTTPATPVTLEIFDDAAEINGDDFAMTGVSFYLCN